MRHVLLMFFAMFLVAFSCKERKPVEVVAKVPFVYVKKDMQQLLRLSIENSKATGDVFALYSSGGWSDVGQFVLNGNILSYTKPNSKTFQTKEITADKVAYIKQQVDNWIHYENYNPKISDGVQYNFIYFKANEGKITDVKQLYMNNPGVNRDGENVRYKEITDFFQGLVAEKGVTF